MVSDTKAEINTAAASVTPNSRNNLPTKPSKNITGKKTTASVSEVEITAKNISLLPSRAAFLMGMPSSNFRKIFSVTTIPSSTTNPVASTIPNKVSILIENPKRYITKKVAINDIGISISGRIAISQLRKKKKITNTTSPNEIMRVSFTSLSDLRMISVLSIITLNSISDLFDFLIVSSLFMNSSAISILFAPGCGIMASPTAFSPFTFQDCSSCSGAISTEATSLRRTIPEESSRIIKSLNCCSLVSLPSARMVNSVLLP